MFAHCLWGQHCSQGALSVVTNRATRASRFSCWLRGLVHTVRMKPWSHDPNGDSTFDPLSLIDSHKCEHLHMLPCNLIFYVDGDGSVVGTSEQALKAKFFFDASQCQRTIEICTNSFVSEKVFWLSVKGSWERFSIVQQQCIRSVLKIPRVVMNQQIWKTNCRRLMV